MLVREEFINHRDTEVRLADLSPESCACVSLCLILLSHTRLKTALRSSCLYCAGVLLYGMTKVFLYSGAARVKSFVGSVAAPFFPSLPAFKRAGHCAIFGFR